MIKNIKYLVTFLLLFVTNIQLSTFNIQLSAAFAQKKYAMYAIGFYNQENLFDTCHDEGKRDFDFLPTGSYKWTGLKYSHKLHNMAQALSDMGTDKLPVGCAFIGLAEVENVKCLRDLCAQEPLAKRNMKYVLFEGVDNRGIDVGCIYNPALFKLDTIQTKLVPFEAEDTTFHTRGFLCVHGAIDGEHVVCIVCHLPSRLHGDDTYRVLGAQQVTRIKEQLMAQDKKVKIFVMGDMNDDPIDRSMTKGLSGKEKIDEVGKNDMYNPWIDVIKSGTGTLRYDGAWNLFDQILLSPNMLVKGAQNYQKDVLKDCTTLKFYGNQIFRRDYLFQTEGRYKGNPKRTHAGGQWLDGYSDHLPVVVYLVKEKK